MARWKEYKKGNRDVGGMTYEWPITDGQPSIADMIGRCGRGGADDKKKGDVKIKCGISFPVAIECPLALGSYQTGRTNESLNFIDAPDVVEPLMTLKNHLRE